MSQCALIPSVSNKPKSIRIARDKNVKKTFEKKSITKKFYVPNSVVKKKEKKRAECRATRTNTLFVRRRAQREISKKNIFF